MNDSALWRFDRGENFILRRRLRDNVPASHPSDINNPVLSMLRQNTGKGEALKVGERTCPRVLAIASSQSRTSQVPSMTCCRRLRWSFASHIIDDSAGSFDSAPLRSG